MKRLIAIATVALLALALAAPAAANNRTGNGHGPPTFEPEHVYVGGELYDTIILGSLPYNGHNGHSFNHIYPVFGPDGPTGGEVQLPVAPYAPGDPEYRGGRWVPVPLVWTDTAPVPFPELHGVDDFAAHMAAGHLVSLGEQPQLAFECPLLP